MKPIKFLTETDLSYIFEFHFRRVIPEHIRIY